MAATPAPTPAPVLVHDAPLTQRALNARVITTLQASGPLSLAMLTRRLHETSSRVAHALITCVQRRRIKRFRVGNLIVYDTPTHTRHLHAV